ncbi:MAG: HNH endonuclease [Deltaproteobacteria bacterium]
MSPLCVQCGKPATDVDHVNSVAAHPELRLAPSNLRSFCHRCHSARTARDQGFARRSGARAP